MEGIHSFADALTSLADMQTSAVKMQMKIWKYRYGAVATTIKYRKFDLENEH